MHPSSSGLTAIFSALADPSRREILERLRKNKEATVSELAEPLEMSLPAVSKHLKILEKAGLLKRRKDGRTHFMRLNPGPLKNASEWLAYYEQFWTESFDRLDQYLRNSAADATDEQDHSPDR